MKYLILVGLVVSVNVSNASHLLKALVSLPAGILIAVMAINDYRKEVSDNA